MIWIPRHQTACECSDIRAHSFSLTYPLSFILNHLTKIFEVLASPQPEAIFTVVLESEFDRR